MPRIRTIKPEIHLDEELWDLETETGFPVFRAFTGLINHADREGRFEWRPRKLKAGILPYWEGDFSRVLHALVTRGFLVRYASQGREYGWIRTFKRHQNVNNREAESVLPPCPAESGEVVEIPGTSTRAPRVDDACPTPLLHAPAEGKGREGKGREGNRATRGADAPSGAARLEVREAFCGELFALGTDPPSLGAPLTERLTRRALMLAKLHDDGTAPADCAKAIARGAQKALRASRGKPCWVALIEDSEPLWEAPVASNERYAANTQGGF